MRRIWILALPLLVLGCADKQLTPVLGHWTGGFYADEAELLRGYLQLYKTGDKFKMTLASKDQSMNFDGTWKMVKNRVELTISNVDFENPTQENQRALGLKILKPEDVREAYGKPIALDLNADKTELKGLTMKIGGLQGSHRFGKGDVTPNTRRALDNIEGKK